MNKLKDVLQLRVCYSETDQMGTFYNSRALESFECGRTELMRTGCGCLRGAEEKGVFLPLVEAHSYFRAARDMMICWTWPRPWNFPVAPSCGLKFKSRKTTAANRWCAVTPIHAFTDTQGKPIRPPEWFMTLMEKAA